MNQRANLTPHTTLKQLKVSERTLSKASDAALTRLRCYDLDELKHTLDENLKEERLGIVDGCNLVQQSLNQLYKNVVSEEKIKRLDVEYYEKHVQELLMQLANVKAFVFDKLKSLKDEERVLQEEVNVAERLCNNTNSLSVNKTVPFRALSRAKTTLTFDQDVDNFQKFLARTGGHTGNWDDEEHRLFQKLWYKFRLDIFDHCDDEDTINIYDDEFQCAVRQMLPDKTSEEVSSHVKWMNKYNRLKKLKEIALENWKALRRANKCNGNRTTSENDLKILNMRDYVDFQIVKQELEQWRAMKNVEKRNNSHMMADVAIAKKELDYLKKEDRKIDKELVFKWVNARRLQYQEMERHKAKEETEVKQKKIAKANKKIKEYRARDQTHVSRRLTIVKKQLEDESQKTIHRNSNAKNKTAIRGQYTKSTEIWSRRMSEKKNKSQHEQKCTINGIEAIPKLAVPKWRQGLVMR